MRRSGRHAASQPVPTPTRTISVLALTAIMLWGCQSLFPPLIAESDGSGMMTVSILGALPEVPPAATLQIDLTRGDYKLQQRVPFVGEAQSVTIENIAAGPWDVTVRLLDESGIPTYEGAGSAHVQAGKSVNTHVVLMPRPGQLAVTVVFDEQCPYVRPAGCLADLATSGRVYINPGLTQPTDRHDFSWTPGETEAALPAVTLPPGSYDFQLVFYAGSRIPSNEVFLSFWTPFDILPGRTTTAMWHPEIGLLDIGVAVHGPPPAPRSLTARVSGNAITLTWKPPAPAVGSDGAVVGDDAATNSVVGYNLYGRHGVREAFRLLANVAAPATSWQHTDYAPCADGEEQPYYYVVTAFTHTNYESLRSNEATVCASSVDGHNA